MASAVSATIRMYRLNELGDCFLVSFAAGQKASHLLIDCGSFRNSGDSITRIKQITEQLHADIGHGSIDVVVGTHQHNDHLSGFLHAEDEFKKIGVKEVWLSWLDDPSDKTAQKIGKAHHNLRRSLASAMHKMRAHPGARAAKSLGVLEDMMGFFGAGKKKEPPEVPMKATQVLKKISGKAPEYLEPGDVRDLPGLPAGVVKVHVLGPPRANDSLYRKNPKKGETYDHALAASERLAAAMLRALDRAESDAQSQERQYPFGAQHKKHNTGSAELKKLKAHYAAESWRTVDDDWMAQAETLALFLNDFTNNSSLVLAIELVASKKVLLFAADAQAGNWASWKDIKWPVGHPGTSKLLERTVFYKVGHHASHNATLVEAFEGMGGGDLCALIPVHKKDPNITKKKNGWKMPAKGLFKRLVERTEGRVLQMDGVNPVECDPSTAKVKASWKKAGFTPKVGPMAIELEIK